MTIIHVRRLLVIGLVLAGATGAASAEDARSMLDESTYRSLVAEDKALHVGDVLTVIVQEAASASSSVDLRAQRRFRAGAQMSASKADPYSAAASTETASDGAGRTERSGRLLAQVSVRVIDINENGDLVVAGRQQLEINREEQLITLRGIVRPRDVTEGNTVLSSRIADAQIKFDGKGFVASQSRPGWLARFFTLLGL